MLSVMLVSLRIHIEVVTVAPFVRHPRNLFEPSLNSRQQPEVWRGDKSTAFLSSDG